MYVYTYLRHQEEHVKGIKQNLVFLCYCGVFVLSALSLGLLVPWSVPGSLGPSVLW